MPKTSRRDFLRWTLAGSGLLLAGAASVLEPAPARAVTRLGAPAQQTALFMGTMVSITVACPSSTQAHDAMDLAFAEGRRLEALLTRHDAAAPLGVLNSQGSLRDVPPELLNVWQRAHGICHLTGGAFDATVLPLVRLLESRSNPEGELELAESDLREALALVDTDAVYAGRDGMRLERQGMGLTLDGIAKGHIVDAMSAVLLRAGCENHLINAGGDILARGHKAPGVFWRVAVEDPEKRGHYPQVLELYNQAIATSGGYEMHYDAEGRHHHLLDPSTGRSPVLGSMSVLAATCMQADALATGLSVLPAGEALTLAEAEAHGIAPEEVHFHEVGAVDTLVDILGACWALDRLGVERVTACALPWFGGSITCAHGEIPLPAPATANLMRGLPVHPTDAKTELVTPTGAALARVLVDEFVDGPEGRLLAMGTGYGARPAPTGLRAWLVEAREPRQADHGRGGEEDVMQLECHLDHLTGEELGTALERLAADAGVNPNTMQRALQELETRGLLQAQRTAGRTVTADDTALQALRRRRAGTLAAEFLHQMQALGLTEAEIETLLRETAQQAPKKE